MTKQRLILMAWPKEPADAPPMVKLIDGPAQPQFQAAIDSGRFRRVAALVAHEFESWEART